MARYVEDGACAAPAICVLIGTVCPNDNVLQDGDRRGA